MPIPKTPPLCLMCHEGLARLRARPFFAGNWLKSKRLSVSLVREPLLLKEGISFRLEGFDRKLLGRTIAMSHQKLVVIMTEKAR